MMRIILCQVVPSLLHETVFCVNWLSAVHHLSLMRHGDNSQGVGLAFVLWYSCSKQGFLPEALLYWASDLCLIVGQTKATNDRRVC